MNIQYKRKDGITLISLVITIIALIILSVITLKYGFESIDGTQDSIIEGNLKMVCQTVLEKYSKEEALGNTDIKINENKGAENHFFGEVYDTNDDVVWMLKEENRDSYDKLYYKIDENDLRNLGIEDPAKGQVYIVNYFTGEVWDYTNKYYSDGILAYTSGIKKFSQTDDSFIDTNIAIELNGNVIPEIIEDSTSKITVPILIYDEIYKISKLTKTSISMEINGVTIASGKFELQDEEVLEDSKKLKYNIVFSKSVLPVGFENSTIKIKIAGGAIKNSEGEESVYTELEPFIRTRVVEVVLAENLNVDLVPLEEMGYPAKNAIIISSDTNEFELEKVEYNYDYDLDLETRSKFFKRFEFDIGDSMFHNHSSFNCSESKIKSVDIEKNKIEGIPENVFEDYSIGKYAWIYVFTSKFNGPINIKLKDMSGEERSDICTIENVKETILEFNITANEDSDLLLPMACDYGDPINEFLGSYPDVKELMAYIDWGDGEKNYVVEPAFICHNWGKSHKDSDISWRYRMV